MKALISTTEISDVTWITAWEEVTPPTDPVTYQPVTTSTIEDTQRVAEVVADDATFKVYETLLWVDCPDDCQADLWYYKDGAVYIKPENAPLPE